MEGFVVTGLPITAALAAVALIGYIFGRRTRPESQDRATAQGELKRARGVVQQLEAIAQQVRQSLAQHHASVEQFRQRIDDFSAMEGPIASETLALEAQRLTAPSDELTTQITKAYEQLRLQTTRLMASAGSLTDNMTGVTNRRGLAEALRTQLALQRRYKTSFSLGLFEVDGYAQLRANGPIAADEVLQQVAATLDTSSRETDVVCRYGEDQFAVILPHTNLAGAAIYAERVREILFAKVPIAVNGGVTVVLDGDTSDSLLARVDEALFAARGAGPGKIIQHTGLEVLPVLPQLAPSEEQPVPLSIARTDAGMLRAGDLDDKASLKRRSRVAEVSSGTPLQPR